MIRCADLLVRDLFKGFENGTIVRRFGFLCGNLRQGNHMFTVFSSFWKISVDETFFVHTDKAKPAFSKHSGLKSVFEKPRCRDILVWTVGITVAIKLRF